MPDERWGPVDVEYINLPAEPRARRERARRERRPPSGRGALAAGFAAMALLVGVVVLVVTRHGDDGPAGVPSSYPAGSAVAAESRYGATVPGSVALLADDVADPDGGPPWGLRTFTTTRGYGCLQVGRVQGGRLGVLALASLGGGSVQHGRFHPLPAAPAVQATTCVPQDGAGAAFVATHAILTTAVTPAPCWFDSAGATRLFCPAGTTRTVDAGLLGPRARVVTVQVAGRERRLAVRGAGRQGAYLVVQRPVRPSTLPQTLGGRTYALPNESPLAQTPASNVVTAVSYAGGAPGCRAHPTLSARGSCSPPPGFTPIPQPARGTTRAPVRVAPLTDGNGIAIRFTAPVAARDARSDYRAFIRGPGNTDLELTLAGSVAAGTPVRQRVTLPPGRYRVDVRYRVRPPFPRTNGGLESPGSPVGTAAVRVRPRR